MKIVDKLVDEMNKTTGYDENKPKTEFQKTKEKFYDKLPFNVKQLDIAIVAGIIALIITFIFIALDALNII